MVLMVFFSSRISPRASTVIFLVRSPLATAVVTSAMLRTWLVRLPAMKFTESVRSFHVPATPGTLACPPSRPSEPTSRATRVTSDANALSWSTIVLMVWESSSTAPLAAPLPSEVALGDRRRDVRDVSHLARQVAGHRVHRVGQVLPRAGDAAHLGLAAQLPVGTDLSRDARHLRRERRELIDHRVD